MTASAPHFSAPRPRGSSLAGKAYWAMVQRVTVIAGAIDVGYIFLFAWLGASTLAWINVLSVLLYAAAYGLIGRKQNTLALLLIWFEVMAHAAIGSLLIGWDSGFHYFLLLFIPAIVVANSRGFSAPIVLGLLLYYLGLKAVCDQWGPLTPLPGAELRTVFWVHVCLVFAMSASIAAFYRRAILSAERRLVEQAQTDALTGLRNRTGFQSQASEALARSQALGESVAVLLGDVDHFKQFNDRHGHEAGDRVLIHVARTLQTHARGGDLLARWGGEEFLLLMPGCTQAQAEAAAERIRQAVVGTQIPIDGAEVPLSLSLGVACLGPEESLQSGISRADRALYDSKHAGRNRVTLALPLAVPA
jgi:diguanylate cyclase (GGDEF)-like protein